MEFFFFFDPSFIILFIIGLAIALGVFVWNSLPTLLLITGGVILFGIICAKIISEKGKSGVVYIAVGLALLLTVFGILAYFEGTPLGRYLKYDRKSYACITMDDVTFPQRDIFIKKVLLQ